MSWIFLVNHMSRSSLTNMRVKMDHAHSPPSLVYRPESRQSRSVITSNSNYSRCLVCRRICLPSRNDLSSSQCEFRILAKRRERLSPHYHVHLLGEHRPTVSAQRCCPIFISIDKVIATSLRTKVVRGASPQSTIAAQSLYAFLPVKVFQSIALK